MTHHAVRQAVLLLVVVTIPSPWVAAGPRLRRLSPVQLPGGLRSVESALNRGLYGQGMKSLEKVIQKTRDDELKKTAAETLEVVRKHGEKGLLEAEQSAREGYYFDALRLSLDIERTYRGTDIASEAATRVKAWKRDTKARADLEAADLIERAASLAGARKKTSAQSVLLKVVNSKKYSETRSKELAADMLASLARPGAWTPVTGRPVPGLQAIDDAVVGFARETGLQAATLALARNGKVLYARGFGWSDRARKVRTLPDTPMRVASVSKPITHSIIKDLIREGKLTGETRVYRFLGIEPVARRTPDPRLSSLTVQHLLDHEGGWDGKQTFDPMFAGKRIGSELRLRQPPNQRQIIQYMFGKPLQFAPGTRSSYSNFGYCVLGRVIEKVTGSAFSLALQKHISTPLDAPTIQVGRTRIADRPPEEVSYPDDGTASYRIEILDSGGGLISTTADLCRFMAAYWIGGDRRKQTTGFNYTFFGSLPCTTAMIRQRLDGVDIAVLFNGRRADFERDNERLRALLDKAVDGITDWPKGEGE